MRTRSKLRGMSPYAIQRYNFPMTITLDKPTQRRLEALAKKQNRPTEEVAAALVATSLFKERTVDRESELLRLISEGLPEGFWSRKAELDAKAEAVTLTPDEYQERLGLLTELECWQVARLEAVVELAQLREQTPHAVMQKLGILPV
jgi:predicted transcriptional regulator